MFEKLYGFNIEYTKEQTLFQKNRYFWICISLRAIRRIKTDKNNNLDWDAWTHMSVNFIQFHPKILKKNIFLCDKGLQSLIIDFVANLLAEKK